MNKAKYLVIVESPAKARTISKMLSNEYVVKSSFGHVMDLPKNKLGFDPEKNFKTDYQITKDKVKVVRELKSYIDKNTIVYLASDDDREGSAIASTLIVALNLDKERYRRVIFHEITKSAVLYAINNPIELDVNLSDAATARRVMDRAVGYKLSPLLWRKIKFGLSAGRVQSVAVRIVADKEKEIQAFNPVEFWSIKLDILSKPEFKAELHKSHNQIVKVNNKAEADVILRNCNNHAYSLDKVDEKNSERKPAPPFTTSTLQQAASSRLGYSPKVTMNIAQRLYEGSIDIPGHTGGIITYMRTDSFNLSTVATDAAKHVIVSEYGKEYHAGYVRTFNKTAKGAQEAHEAIRPVRMDLKPDDISRHLEPKEYKLYKLIWSRTIATQMANANVANTTYRISGGNSKQYEFVAKGTKIIFPGFMKAYDVGTNDTVDKPTNEEKFLPNVPLGTVFDKTKLTAEQNYTNPPSRYTEASLIKKLEQEGIGRPATYAPTITTIQSRGYVEINKDKKLIPTPIGVIVNDYLVEHFSDIVDLKFTANMETEFDKISRGVIKWQEVLRLFYTGFVKNIDSKQDTDRVQYSEAVILGVDDETGLDIQLKTGQYGTYLQVGYADKENKIKPHKISPIPNGVSKDEITLEKAKYFLRVPRILGDKDGKSVKVAIGKFGAYIGWSDKFYSITPSDETDPYEITLEKAVSIINRVDTEKANSLLWTMTDVKHGTLSIINGRYGPYLHRTGTAKGYKKGNFKLPKILKLEDIPGLKFADIENIINNQPVNKFKKITR